MDNFSFVQVAHACNDFLSSDTGAGSFFELHGTGHITFFGWPLLLAILAGIFLFIQAFIFGILYAFSKNRILGIVSTLNRSAKLTFIIIILFSFLEVMFGIIPNYGQKTPEEMGFYRMC